MMDFPSACKKEGAMSRNGFSLAELMVVMAIMGILMSIVGLAYNEWRRRYDLESQVRTMYVDLLSARAQALQKNKSYFMDVQSGSYRLFADVDDSGGTAPNADDEPALWTKSLRFAATAATMAVMDARGLVSPAATIRFTTGGVSAEFDCIVLTSTRIRMGKLHGTECRAQ